MCKGLTLRCFLLFDTSQKFSFRLSFQKSLAITLFQQTG
ncbi:hypothetical protein BREVNS_0966 [Brevinematales bacterium NS]|nr:hypothetical protein BREVNS_0966 [Brevinematales bacterium NS]